ncbi:MAG: helix-turn-helix transcriptional regulator [Clostridiales bacterium]|nr:helix-turn-helix transcriptional regulator [Clostridia bacterium]MCR5353905.1 helix-turn-helix transcriptional regulator [Clostridiales bacterium]
MQNKIAELRKEKDMTQKDLADALFVSRQTVISLESGRYSPSLSLAHKIAKTFGKTIEEIFVFGEDE